MTMMMLGSFMGKKISPEDLNMGNLISLQNKNQLTKRLASARFNFCSVFASK